MRQAIKCTLWLIVLAAGAVSITLLYLISKETFWGVLGLMGTFILACVILARIEKKDKRAERTYSTRAYKSVSGGQPRTAIRKIYFK